MKKIFKYSIEITDEQTIVLPFGAEILTVQIQHGKPYLWALIETEQSLNEPKIIEVFGTGNPIPEGDRRYINSIQIFNGDLIFHVFEKI